MNEPTSESEFLLENQTSFRASNFSELAGWNGPLPQTGPSAFVPSNAALVPRSDAPILQPRAGDDTLKMFYLWNTENPGSKQGFESFADLPSDVSGSETAPWLPSIQGPSKDAREAQQQNVFVLPGMSSGREFILESEKPWKDTPHSHYLRGATPENHHQQSQFMSSPTTNISLVSSMATHTTPADTILDPYHSFSTGTFSSHPILNKQDGDSFFALSRNPGSDLVTTSPGRGASSFPTASFSGDPSLYTNRSTGTFSRLPILDEQESDYFSGLIQSRNSTTSPAYADFISMSGEPYLFGSLPLGTLSGLPILNEQRPVHFPALIQSVTTSPGRADFTPVATLVGDPPLSGNLSSGTLSGLPILDEPELEHLSALIQSRNLATTSPGRADYIPMARLSGELSVSESFSTGTLSGLPLLNEQESADFSALSQSCNPVTTSLGRADYIPMFAGTTGYHRTERRHSSGEASLSGSLSTGSLSGPLILDEQRPDDPSMSRNLVTTSPGRADYIPMASLYGDPSLSASFYTGTFSGLPIRNQDGSNHFSALIQSQSPGSDLVATSAQRGEDFIPIVPCAADPSSSGTEPSRFPNVTRKPDASPRRKAPNRDTPRGGSATRKPKKGIHHKPYTIFHHENPGSSKMSVPSKRHLLSNSTAHPWKGRKKGVPDEFGFVEPFTVPDPAINNDPKAIIWTSETTSVGMGHSQYGVPPPYAVFPPSDQSP